MEYKFSNKFLRDFIKISPYEEVQKFESECSKFITMLEDLPSLIENPSQSTEEWMKLLLSDYGKAVEQLKIETEFDIKFLWTLTSFKNYRLIKSILNLINEYDFYSAVPLIRAMTEVNCLCFSTKEQLLPLVSELNTSINDFFKYMKIHQKIEKLLLQANRSTRHEGLLEEMNDIIYSKGITESIKLTSKNDKFNSIYNMYKMLCDYTHPNVSSNSLFGVLTRLNTKSHDVFRMNEKFNMGIVRGEMDKFYREFPDELKLFVAKFDLAFLLSIILKNIELFSLTINELKGVFLLTLKDKDPSIDFLSDLSDIQKEEYIDYLKKQKLLRS